MQHSQLIEKITQLGFQGFREAYMRQIEDISYDTLGFEERLYQLLDAQSIFLKNKQIAMSRKLSRIKDKQAAIEAIDFRSERRLDKAVGRRFKSCMAHH